jgi:hypothetical protein
VDRGEAVIRHMQVYLMNGESWRVEELSNGMYRAERTRNNQVEYQFSRSLERLLIKIVNAEEGLAS